MAVRKISDEFSRIHNVIQADKSVMSESCKALALKDFANKFDEYFDMVGLPRMEVACQNGTYTVQIAFEAERIKKFNVLK